MSDTLFLSMMFNVGFLVMIASLMSRTALVKNLLLGRSSGMGGQLLLALFFGMISVLSTYIGIGVNGAIVNTRAIGVLAAGLMGGPVAGMGAACIGGLHRWLFDIGGFTSVACACSTILGEGVLGCVFHRRFQSGRLKGWQLVLLGAVAEIGQMAFILLLARPFWQAVALVRVIALPMIVMNSCGIVAFIGAFQHIFIEENSLVDSRIRQAMHIAEQCLPYLRKGLYSKADLDRAVEIIRSGAHCDGVAVCDRQQMLSSSGFGFGEHTAPPSLLREVMDGGETRVAIQTEDCPELAALLERHIVIAAPLTRQGSAIGCLVLLEPHRWLPLEAERGFIEGLAMLFSTQLELSQVEYQKSLLQKAEFQRLQSQVNPHFLFNSLNTISYFCRENPERARELLLLLGQYYRYSTDENDGFVPLGRELKQVETYLKLEKARFEDRISVSFRGIETVDLERRVPSLILQPIVENAIKHGADERGLRWVSVTFSPEGQGIVVRVEDRGQGFPQEVLTALDQGSLPGNKVGLQNVHRRLKSIYGEENGLKITSGAAGSTVTICFPDGTGKGLLA